MDKWVPFNSEWKGRNFEERLKIQSQKRGIQMNYMSNTMI